MSTLNLAPPGTIRRWGQDAERLAIDWVRLLLRTLNFALDTLAIGGTLAFFGATAIWLLLGVLP